MRSILRGAIAPAASGLKDMQDATDHPAIVYARLARLAAWKMGLNRCPGVIRQPQQMRHSGLLISETQRSRDSPKRFNVLYEFSTYSSSFEESMSAPSDSFQNVAPGLSPVIALRMLSRRLISAFTSCSKAESA